VSDSLLKLLLRRSEGGRVAVLWGQEASLHFGRAFDRLLTAGVVVERAPATSWSTCRRCDGTCGEREIIELDGSLTAECPHFPSEAMRLAPHDVRSFSIDVGALLAELAQASGLGGEHELVTDGLWLLGQAAGGRSIFLVTGALALAAPSSLTLIAARAAPSTSTLLVPDIAPAPMLRPYRDAGCHLVAVEQAMAADGIRFNVDALAPALARRSRLIFNRTGPVFVLDDRTLALTDQSARLLAALADAARQHEGFLTRDEVQTAVYGKMSLPEARTLRDVARDLRDQMSAGLADADALAVRGLIENRRVERYRLALPSHEIQIAG
jgi:hypothetical protein